MELTTYSHINSSSSYQYGLTDTHTHLADAVFDHDRNEVLKRAYQVGVTRIVIVPETLDECTKILQLSNRYKNLSLTENPFPVEIIPAAGLYPTYLDITQANRVIDFIDCHIEEIIVIGEVGLDHWKVQDDNDRAIQREIFQMFIKVAQKYSLILNIHSRSAGKHALNMLIDHNARKVQMHAFDGKVSTAMMGVEAGFYFSIPPSIVRSPQKQKLVKSLPLSCLLLETDSPVLGADPNTRNEPSQITVSLNAIAEIKGISPDEIKEAVIHNTHQLYS